MNVIETLPAVRLNTEHGPVVVTNPARNPLGMVDSGDGVHIAQQEAHALCGRPVIGGRRNPPGAQVTCQPCKNNHWRVIVWACNELVARLNAANGFTV